MIINNSWVGYLTRSYIDIKKSIIKRLSTYTPEITDFSEGNPLVILVSIFAGIAEMLGYYIDNQARESFIITARKYASVRLHAQGLDYHVRAAYPATADILFKTVNNSGVPLPLAAPYTINQGDEVIAGNGLRYVIQKSGTIGVGEYFITLPVSQYIERTSVNLGTTTGAANQSVSLGKKYADRSAQVTINSIAWALKDTLGLSGPTDKHFIVDVDSTGNAFIIFGDGTNGAIPPSPFSILVDFRETEAENGNQSEDTITNLGFTATIPGGKLICTNPNPATAGSPYDTLETIRMRAPISIRTLDRAVSYYDYEEVPLLVAGVAKSKVHFCCGKKIQIYVAPTGGGIAASGLLSDVKDYMDDGRKIITTFIQTLAAGEGLIYLEITSKTKFSIKPTLAQSDIRAALLEAYSFDNQKINGKIRMSDIYAKVDNLAKVDYLHIDTLMVMPYARPRASAPQLTWTRKVLIDCKQKTKFTLIYRSATTDFIVVRDGRSDGIADLGVSYTDTKNTVTFKITGTYTNGDKWDFYCYPINQDIELDDYSVPVLLDSNLITITNGNYNPDAPTC